MKLLIFTCLMAVALAKPKLPLRHPELIQNEPDGTEEVLKQRKFFKFALSIPGEIRKEHNNEWNKRRLREKQSDELKQKILSSSSLSEEVVPTSTKEQLSRTNEYDHVQRLDVYPYAVWYYPPQIIQYIPYLPFYDITKPITSENIEKTDITSE
ncbi:alpha-S1-casein isoform X2 [Pteropus medius]|uniref:alpha-S1-casein isoform X2 n=1 Tax=Pteropus vampyrus TaxID=132908 RepID=UPI00196A4777|nr:alpha-S1-casein isoform X2 [Pteropus giganteus]